MPAAWGDLWPAWVDSLGRADPGSWAAFSRAAAGHGAAAGAAGLGLIAAAGCGAAPLRWLWPALPAPLALASGLGVAAMLQHGLGLAGLFRPVVFAAEGGAAVAAGAAWLARRRAWRDVALPRAGQRGPAVVVALLAGLCLLLTRLPDTHDDPRTYHFAAPESYLRTGRVHAEPLNVNWHMPRGAEMLNALGWAAGDIEGAKLVNLIVLAALLGAASLLAPGAGWWTPAFLLCAGLVPEECWQGKNDLVLALHVTAAAVCAVAAVTGRTAGWLGAGWFLGHAAAVKFTAGFPVLGLAVGAVAALRGRLPWRETGAAAALGAIPVAGWLAESWLQLGNPLHPFLSSVFSDLGWGPLFQSGLRQVMRVLSPVEARSRVDWALGAWRAWGDPATGSPLVLALAIPVLIRAPGPVAALARWSLLAGYLSWLPTERNARYLFPFVPALAALAGAAVAAAAGRTAARGLRILLACAALGSALGGATHLVPDGWQRLAGRLDRDAFRLRRFTTWEAVRRRVNAVVPPGDRILFTGEERRLWFAPRVRSGFTVCEPLFWKWTGEAATPAELRKKVRQAGLGWHLHNFVSMKFRALTRFAGPPWSDRQLALYAEFTRRYVEPVAAPDRVDHANGGFWLFRFARRPAGPFPVYFLPHTEGAFALAYRLAAMGRPLEAPAAIAAQLARMPGVMESRMIAIRFDAVREEHATVARRLAVVNATGFIGDANFRYAAAAALHAGRWGEGLALFSRAFRLTADPDLLPGIAYAFERRGEERLARGRPREGLRDLEQAVRCAPGEPSVRAAYEAARDRTGTRGWNPAAR